MNIIVREKFYEITASEGKYLTDGSIITDSVYTPFKGRTSNDWVEIEGTLEEIESKLQEVPSQEIEAYLRQLLESEEVPQEELEEYLKNLEL